MKPEPESDANTATIERRLLGFVEVDSGTLLIGDPTYVLPRASEGRSGVDYQAVIDAPMVDGARLAGQPALLLSNFGGDGSYPVIGEYEDGELMRAIVEFVGPDEDEDHAVESGDGE
jgi:hypothetical protein